MVVALNIETPELSATVRRLQAVGAAPSRMRQILAPALQILEGELQRSTKSHLDKDPTGSLMRSWRPRIQGRGRSVRAGVFSDRPYARIHDVGGVIKPTSGRYLAIPAEGTRPRGVWPRDYPGQLVFQISKASGKPYLLEVGRGRPRVAYWLREQVEIRATHYVRAATTTARPAMADAILQALRRELEGATRRGGG